MKTKILLLSVMFLIVAGIHAYSQTPNLLAVPKIPKEFDDLIKMVDSPSTSNYDRANKILLFSPAQLNLRLATTYDMSRFGLGKGVSIPTFIGNEGRSTIYELPVGATTLVHIFVSGDLLAKIYYTRIGGSGPTATSGDKFQMDIKNIRNETISTHVGELRIVDRKTGRGQLEFPGNRTEIWVLWSGIRITD